MHAVRQHSAVPRLHLHASKLSVLSRRDQASYGFCRQCQDEIPVSRLRVQPQAVLCADCIEERLERLYADSL
ncbi:hypothetical protein FBQ96_05315 [Nitrospirales bacterium NOB]|nr:MAG: DnaK suppressor protein [Nitrospira sp. OLB3]MBV6470679.1 RNA polymerase-binding transcription factor DksA [Nitrospirota bacterium]MCE7964904.1 hypothetical protein [Nitrospira sp. NTP2]MDL1888989.1 hypothetical protein [Nitrospirales bacterium NOB]QOJ36294.1 MAG: TraR/DksA C4-type zinc finger protein [Nitrospira sp.]